MLPTSKHRSHTIVLGVIVLVASCKDAAIPAQDAATSSATQTSTHAKTSTMPAMGLGETLRAEVRSRPTGTPTVEAVHQALLAGGLTLSAPRQALGLTVGASYCSLAGDAAGIGIAICEYADEARALQGRQLSLERFKAIEHREILVNKKTTLTIRNSAGTDEAKGRVEKMREIFSRL